MEKRLPLILTCLSGAVLILVCVSYAWFSYTEYVNSMKFQLAKIDSIITIFSTIDSNYNGVPDWDSTLNDGAGGYVVTQKGEPISASAEGTLADVSLNIGRETNSESTVLPSQINTYKINVFNRSEAQNTIRFAFGSTSGTVDELTFQTLKAFSVRVCEQDANNNINFIDGHKIYLGNSIIDNNGVAEFNLTDILSDILISGAYVTDGSNQMDLWLQFILEPYESLKENVTSNSVGSNVFSSQSDYQLIMGQSVVFPQITVYLEVN